MKIKDAITTTETLIDTRISIHDLVFACKILGEVRVLAAGSLYATLATDFYDRQRLTASGIPWTFD